MFIRCAHVSSTYRAGYRPFSFFSSGLPRARRTCGHARNHLLYRTRHTDARASSASPQPPSPHPPSTVYAVRSPSRIIRQIAVVIIVIIIVTRCRALSFWRFAGCAARFLPPTDVGRTFPSRFGSVRGSRTRTTPMYAILHVQYKTVVVVRWPSLFFNRTHVLLSTIWRRLVKTSARLPTV